MPERIKLKVLELRDLKKIGDKGAEKLEFKAKNGEGEHWYFTFSKRLFPLIIKDKALEAEVDTTIRVVGDITYTDRKVTEIYIDGQPSRLPQALTGVQMGFQKDTESIERQVAFKGLIELLTANIVTLDSPYGQAAIAWAMGKLGVAIPRAVASPGQPEKVEDEVKAPEPEAIPSGHYKAPIYLVSVEQQDEIRNLAKALGIKAKDFDKTKFEAGVRVVNLSELTEDEGNKIISYLKGMKEKADA